MTDLNGRLVFRTLVEGEQGSTRMDTEQMASGLYYLHLQGADGRQAGQMIVVQR